MVRVRSKYAGKLAVLSVWLTALIPWSVSFAQLPLAGERASFVVLRFPLNLTFPNERPFLTVVGAATFESGAVARAYTVWLVGAAVFALALLLSVAYYALDDRLEASLPVYPVRLMAVVLLATVLVLGLSTVLLYRSYLGGAVPVGVFSALVLCYLLLLVERTGAGAADD